MNAVPRDLAFERRWTTDAAQLLNVSPRSVGALVAFAEARAREGGVTGFPARDLAREGLEELADARNYIVWRLRELYLPGKDGVDMEVVTPLSVSLAHVVAAHERLAGARILGTR